MMASNKFVTCLKCGRIARIVNRTKYLCDDCNYRRLHDGKSRFEVAKEKRKAKPIRKRKATGELEMFKEIWEERPHVCVKCGKRLLEPLRPAYFSHIKSKGAFPELRLVKENVELVCPECHYAYEFGFRNSKSEGSINCEIVKI